jgi:hypothetical protein
LCRVRRVEAGLDFHYFCDRIGPEHTAEELVEQMFLGIEYGCDVDQSNRVLMLCCSAVPPGVGRRYRLAQVFGGDLSPLVAEDEASQSAAA